MTNKLSIFLIVTLIFSEAIAQEKSVNELIELGLSHAKEIEAKNLEVRALDKLSISAGSWENPSLSLDLGSRDQMGGAAKQTRINISQPIGIGQYKLRGEAANLSAQIGRFETAVLSISLRFKLYNGLFAYIVADEKLRHAEERINRFKDVQGFLRSRTFASPQKRAEASIVSEKIQVLQKDFLHLRSQRNILWEELNLFLVLSDRPHIRNPWFAKGLDFDFETLWRKLESQNPEFKIRHLSLERAEKEIGLAQKERWKGIFVSGSYSSETGYQPEQTYGLGVTFPLPMLNSGSSNVQASELRKSAAVTKFSFEEATDKKNLRTALINYQSARETIRVLPLNSIRIQEASMKVTDQGFRKSQVDLLTYIEADNQHSEGLNAIFDAQAEFAQALSQLLSLTAETQIPEEN